MCNLVMLVSVYGWYHSLICNLEMPASMCWLVTQSDEQLCDAGEHEDGRGRSRLRSPDGPHGQAAGCHRRHRGLGAGAPAGEGHASPPLPSRQVMHCHSIQHPAFVSQEEPKCQLEKATQALYCPLCITTASCHLHLLPGQFCFVAAVLPVYRGLRPAALSRHDPAFLPTRQVMHCTEQQV